MTVAEPSTPDSMDLDLAAPGRKKPIFLMNDSFQTGGSERQFVALASGLKRSTFQVSLGCIQDRGAFREGLGEVQTFPLGGSLYKLASWRTRLRLAESLRASGVQIAQAFDFYSNLTLLPAAYWARIPVIVGSQRQLGDLLSPVQFKAQLLAFRLADAVVCNSQAAASRLHAAGVSPSKLVVIPNGMAAEALAPAVPALPRAAGVLRIGMIARMNTPAKNHRVFLEAIAQLRRRVPKLEAILAGDGPLRPELESQASQLGISSVVQFLGERRDIPAVLASLDASVLPSTSESLSNSIIESMAQGVPVIASTVGGNGELLEDGRGILVPPGDVGALATAMAALLGNESLRKTIGEAARRYAADRFTIENMSLQYEQLYLRLLQGKQ